MKTRRLIAAACFLAAAPCAWLIAEETAAPLAQAPQSAIVGEAVPAPAADSRPAGAPWRFVGTASCTAANCHGGDGSRAVRPGCDPYSPQAYSVWVDRDPHARAFDVLLEPRSQQMAQRLAKQLEGKEAHAAPACLACHAVNATPAELAPTARFTVRDGVSCEACHGAAEGWLDAHKWADWDALSAAQKESLGMHNLRDLATRGRLCADCHVGAEGRDVNHDLIAAGHPRMSFELSAYHANLPKHWNRELAPAGELDARLWVLGQAASAERGLALLAQRAGDSQAPWPEFAEYDCFACHHDLQDPSWRQTELADLAERSQVSAGAAPWGSWNLKFLHLVRGGASGDGASGDGASGDASILGNLRTEMQLAAPDRETAAALARAAHADAGRLVAAAGGAPLGAGQRQAWLVRLTDPAERRRETWDSAAQRYLACAALNFAEQADAATRGQPPPPRARRIQAALAQLRNLLQFSDDDGAAQYDSPLRHASRRAALAQAFDEIHQAAAGSAPPN